LAPRTQLPTANLEYGQYALDLDDAAN